MTKLSSRYNTLLSIRNSKLKILRLFVIVVVGMTSHSSADSKPDLMLAKTYNDNIDVKKYWISEKLDGVRARWNGEILISRNGHQFAAPQWFTEDFPSQTLDGELWLGRGLYEKTSSVVRKQTPHDGWKDVKLMVFDLPLHGGRFGERLSEMKRIVALTDSPYLQVIQQFQVESNSELHRRLQEIVAGGGEGLMLHRHTARYASGRSDDLLKLKLFDDAEAVVIGHRAGKGKYKGLTGSLQVRSDQGRLFYVGSGLSDEQRRNPPQVGEQITFRHQGLSKYGIPRFPVFLRIRNEEPAN